MYKRLGGGIGRKSKWNRSNNSSNNFTKHEANKREKAKEAVVMQAKIA